MVLATEKVSEDACRVKLIGFGPYSIDIEIFAHIGTTDWVDFLTVAEKLNLGTVSVLENAGAKFALPPH